MVNKEQIAELNGGMTGMTGITSRSSVIINLVSPVENTPPSAEEDFLSFPTEAQFCLEYLKFLPFLFSFSYSKFGLGYKHKAYQSQPSVKVEHNT